MEDKKNYIDIKVSEEFLGRLEKVIENVGGVPSDDSSRVLTEMLNLYEVVVEEYKQNPDGHLVFFSRQRKVKLSHNDNTSLSNYLKRLKEEKVDSTY